METRNFNNFHSSNHWLSYRFMDKQITQSRHNYNNSWCSSWRISGMSLVGSEYGVGPAVATLHAVRLITVLLILPLIVKALNIFGIIKS